MKTIFINSSDLNNLIDYPPVPGQVYFIKDTGEVYIDTKQGRIRHNLQLGIKDSQDTNTPTFSIVESPYKSKSIVLDVKRRNDENNEETQENSNIKRPIEEEENNIIYETPDGEIVNLNSSILERESRLEWRVRYGVFKKRIYLFREYDKENDIVYEIPRPYINPNAQNPSTVNFINNTISIPQENIYDENEEQNKWFLNRNHESLIGKDVVVSSIIVFNKESNIEISEKVYGDIPTKYFGNSQIKRDIILFKTKPANYAWEENDLILGTIFFDFKSNELREIDQNAFNGWSSLYTQPSTSELVYGIAVSLTSNEIPTLIYKDQWTKNPKRIEPNGIDGLNARNVFLESDKVLAINYDDAGLNPSPSGVINFTAVSQNFENPEYNFNEQGFSSSDTFTYTIPSNYSSLIEPDIVSVFVRESDNNDIQAYTQTFIAGIKPGEKGEEGEKGEKGDKGDNGPGVVYQGKWNNVDKEYFGDTNRADVVLYNEKYYYCIQTHTTTTTAPIFPTNTSYWSLFGETFDSVATNILLAQNANITKGLVMGDDTGENRGWIRNAGIIGSDIDEIKTNIQNGDTTGFVIDGKDGSITSNKGSFGPLDLGFLNQEFTGEFTTPGGTTRINIADTGILYYDSPLEFNFPLISEIVSLRFEFTMITNTSGGNLIQPPASGGYIIELEKSGTILKTAIISESFSSSSTVNVDIEISLDDYLADKLRIIPFAGKSSSNTDYVEIIGGGTISYKNTREIFTLGNTKIYDNGFIESEKATINNLITENFINTKLQTLNTFTNNSSFDPDIMGGFLVMNQGSSVSIKFPIENFPIGSEIKILRRNGGVTIVEGNGDDSVNLISKNNLTSIQFNGLVTLKQIGPRTWYLYGDLE